MSTGNVAHNKFEISQWKVAVSVVSLLVVVTIATKQIRTFGEVTLIPTLILDAAILLFKGGGPENTPMPTSHSCACGQGIQKPSQNSLHTVPLHAPIFLFLRLDYTPPPDSPGLTSESLPTIILLGDIERRDFDSFPSVLYHG